MRAFILRTVAPTPQQALAARLAARGPAGQLAGMMLGDSMSGFQTYGYGYALADLCARDGYPIQWIGTQLTGIGLPYRPYALLHEGHPGDKIEDITANVATYISAAGVPDFGLINLGTNNAATDSGATMAGKIATLLAACSAAAPSTYWLVSTCKPSPTASPNNANLTSLAGLLPAVCYAAGPQFFFVDPGSLMDAFVSGDASNAWVHPNDEGRAIFADVYYAALRGNVLPPPTGSPYPYVCEPGAAQACLQLTTSGTNIYSHANGILEPGAGSWWVAFQVYIDKIVTGPTAVYSYGYSANAYTLLLTQAGTGASLYLKQNGGAPVSFAAGSTMASFWQANRWHSILIHYDQPNDTISVWRNGVCCGAASGLAPTFPAGDYSFLGYNSSVCSGVGVIGRFRRWAVGSGASVPSYANFRPYAAAHHRAQRLPPGVTGYYLLADAPHTWPEQRGGASITTYSGTQRQSPANEVPEPHDPPNPGQTEHGMCTGVVTLNGTSAVSISAPGAFPANAVMTGTVITAGTTPGLAAPEFVVTAIGTATVTSSTASCNDVIEWMATW